MQGVLHALGGILAATALLIAAPVKAQQAQGEVSCGTKGGASTPDAAISTCTAAIESGKIGPPNLALAYNNRGIAYADKGDVDHALADPGVRARLADLGQDIYPRDQQTPEVLAALQKAEIEKWWPIIKAANIKAE